MSQEKRRYRISNYISKYRKQLISSFESAGFAKGECRELADLYLDRLADKHESRLSGKTIARHFDDGDIWENND